MKTERSRGFALAEVLIVVVLTGIIAAVAVPLFASFAAAQKLDVAAGEVANAMRFAISEANRTGGYIMIDASTAGRIKVYNSDDSGSNQGLVKDPLTKRNLNLSITDSAFSGEVDVTPMFKSNGNSYKNLLIGPGTALIAYKQSSEKGALEAGSGVVLTLGSDSVTVAINEVTALVTLP